MNGQPESGKSGLLTPATDYATDTGDAAAVHIVGDDLQDYHRATISGCDGRTTRPRPRAPTPTPAGVQMAIEHARRNRYSVVIEGTMRNPQVPLATAAALRESGYRVQA